ncbi:MAG: excinuclease ABC subunit C, partial [Gammaproteobacteria bacterium]|nr:excinuclease ABC subunit C [Gammaproteobacteria bacterium]
MFDAKDAVIYVGKAKDLRRRVSSYFVREHTHPKTNALVAEVRRIEVTVTPSESEALILENTLI